MQKNFALRSLRDECVNSRGGWAKYQRLIVRDEGGEGFGKN